MAKKLYYKIGEACKVLEIQPYVLRYWEKEFPLLSPTKSKSGQRVYNQRELEIIGRIKELLYDEGYTIAGAKKKLEAELAEPRTADARTADAPADEPAETGTEGSAPDAEAATAAPAAPRQQTPPAAKTGASANPGTTEATRLRSGVEEALAQAREILGKIEATAR